jgi:hypothetical protein
MNGNLLSAPPPSAAVLEQLFGLIALITDKAAAKAMLDDLTTRTQQLNAAIAANENAAAVAKDQLAAVDQLRQDQAKLAADQESTRKATLQNDVTAAALKDRQTKLAADEAALQQKVKDHEAAVAAHVRRVEQAKAALG